ncbi:chemotaxis protein CheB [Bradyrhizobium sp. Arg816]|uniref:chemotaxis protein CheB n=1 Tax=Bradyrhizobium sp. Arg816 TaxID=2998491 RepID=UPI00249E2E1B|nr:chemotaxis protein CheB [Bradyrhizobium sp. Arg816]MDI3561969.1 PAS domain-containing protein [Bradyrhizobium sp. Arg816]
MEKKRSNSVGDKAGATRRRPPSLVVGIGASAGGLAAFRSFFDHMPADTGMAFVLVQHLDPDHDSLLVELLRPHTAMEVVEAQDQAILVPNQIHVIPPNATLTLEGDVLRVSTPVPPREYRRPIDTFFASLAESQEDCAVGIILSGVGSDGSLGVKAIKEYGGFTLAQAEFDETAMTGMPSSAAATGLVDRVASVESLPTKLLEHQAHLAKVEEQKGADGAREDIRESLTAITALLRKRLKHDFSGYKQNTLIRRIQRRMQVLQIEAVPAYAEHLRREPSEGDALFRELLIGVTQFFRDEEPFEALKANMLPSLLAARDADDPIRVWVAGCATGEEVYSIAILLQEVLGSRRTGAAVTIFATDIDPQAITFARTARFRRMDGLSPERLQRWFVRDGEDYIPVHAIREMCVFSEHNLVRDPPFSRIDLISCRNVLIYMDNDFQHRVMQTFHYALRPGGYLFIGPSESISRESRLFSAADKKHRILQRHDSVRAALPEFLPQAGSGLAIHAATTRTEDQIDKSARRVMAKHSPAYFVIDRHHSIVRYSGGETGRYLEPSEGNASLDLFANLAKSMRTHVRHAVERAFSSGHAIEEEILKVEGGQPVDLLIEPIVESGRPPGLVVVGFRPSRPRDEPTPQSDAWPASQPDVEALQQEFHALQISYQATSDELESQIENMKSVTEEFQSVNEELQSSNEELETAKEEMQSVNEELQTINNELHGKNDLLMQANNDLQNLLDSTQIATIFLDDELCIRNFTPAAREVFSLRDGDRGRPMTDIVSLLSYDQLREDVSKVQRTLGVVESQLDLKDESATYMMRIRPYRTVANVISGVVITFNNISEQKQHHDHLQLLMKELQHRTNNLFAVIQAMARQAVRTSDSLADFEQQFGARVQSLAQSNALLIDQQWKGVSLDKLIEAQLAPFIGIDAGRIEMAGPPATMAAETIQTIGLALHELATNASKYGALSTPNGKVTLNWSFGGGNGAPEFFRLEWQELGGPPVKPSTHKGFGHFVIDQMVTRSLDATVQVDLAPDGLRWEARMPASEARVRR